MRSVRKTRHYARRRTSFLLILLEEVGERKLSKQCAFDKDTQCAALKVRSCTGCNFYQTDIQLAISRAKARARLSDIGLLGAAELAYGKDISRTKLTGR
jgi:hypothetical protein